MGALTPDLELRLRTERHVAELKAAHREHEGREGTGGEQSRSADCCPSDGLRAPLPGARRGNGGGG
jgi:hypothetical protein